MSHSPSKVTENAAREESEIVLSIARIDNELQ